jgi:RNA 2',3'-cyclic 3'-phosphodiesterase
LTAAGSSEPARLFIAVWPPPEVVQRLAALPRPDEPDVRWMPAANWHVTLRFLGTARPDDVTPRLEGVDLPAAVARLGPHVERLGRDGVVVPVAGVTELATVVTAATRGVGRPPNDDPFSGHVTLARQRRRGTRCSLVGHPIQATFAVREIVLARSTLSSTGATYDAVATWRL